MKTPSEHLTVHCHPHPCLPASHAANRPAPATEMEDVTRCTHLLAGSDELWKPKYLSRAWTRPSGSGIVPGGWRKAYCWQCRAEAPLILQLDAARTLAGFANDKQPQAVPCSTPVRQQGRLLLHALAGAVDEALNVLGFGRTPTVGEVCFVAASADTSEDLSELAHVLFRRGATRIRVIDVCVAALCYGLGREAGLVLSFEADGVAVGCVHARKRQPLPQKHFRSTLGIGDAIQCLALPGDTAVGATAEEVSQDLAWLLEKMCYVRAVGLRRLGLSDDEREMSRSTVRAPSGRQLKVDERRFLSLEGLFDVCRGIGSAMLSSLAPKLHSPPHP